MNDKLIELIKGIIKRPAMYGVNSVEDIALIIFGFNFCASASQGKETDFNAKFRSYINKHFEMSGDNDWPRIIRFHSGGNLHSVELFSILFSQYLISNSDTTAI